MDNEVREVVYLSVSTIILAIVLGFVALMLNMQGNMAEIVNSQNTGKENVAQYNEYNEYDRNLVTGYKVIECITQHEDIDIYVDGTKYDANTVRNNILYFQGLIGTKTYNSYLLYNHAAAINTKTSNVSQPYSDVTGIYFKTK